MQVSYVTYTFVAFAAYLKELIINFCKFYHVALFIRNNLCVGEIFNENLLFIYFRQRERINSVRREASSVFPVGFV